MKTSRFLLLLTSFQLNILCAFDCCSDINLELRAGVAPTFWTGRDNFSVISCNADSLLGLPSPFIPLFELPQFHTLFSAPWFIGARVGYLFSEYQEVYAEINYRQGHARTFSLSPLVIPNIDTIQFSITPNNYRAVDAYLGARSYWQSCWCDQINLFIGAKIGLLHHAKTNFSFTTASLIVPPPSPFVSSKLPLFLGNTVPSIGINIGFDFNIICDLFLVITGELVATCGPQSNPNIPFDFLTQSIFINPVLAPNSFIIGPIGTELFIPITLGLKYNF